MKPGRIPCAVVGCRRTASAEKYGECDICCGKCWRLGSALNRRRYRMAARLLKRGLPTTRQIDRAQSIQHRAWANVVREATEARAGVG